MAEKYDLLEVHVCGGPWSRKQAAELEEWIIASLRNLHRVEHVYVADARGPESAAEDES